ncbi:MAG TPA: hypothetical protein VKP10_14100 [Gemmatimonadales bacterium]|nr:hypothetical protein [Gemmatimonadales bacterium]
MFKPTYKTLALVVAGLALAGAAQAQQRTASGGTYTPIDPIRIGGHVGYNFDAEDFALGAQATMPLTRMFEIYPSFDYYFQDIGTLWALNVDLKIRPPTPQGALYVGGGLNYLHFSDAGFSNGDTNLNLLGGFELRRQPLHPYAEARLILGNGSAFQLVGGVSFNLH